MTEAQTVGFLPPDADRQEQSNGADETALVQAAAAGDETAFETLVKRNLRHIRTFVALRAPVPHLADEIAHDTFVFAYRNLGRFTPGTSLRAWLRAIAFNLLRAEIQRHAREQAGRRKYAAQISADEIARCAPSDHSGAEADALEECLHHLPPATRNLLQLKYGDTLASDAIAKLLNQSTAWVRTTLFRLRQALRTCMERRLAPSPGGPA
jgi:RNA polymerase sigma-70 factor (ECF subfamily)